jgi:predicted phosphohydrolase
VFLSDTHNVEPMVEVPDGDVLIHCGDFTSGGGLPEVAKFAAWFRALPHRNKVFIAGNHDFAFEKEASLARPLVACATYLCDETAVVDGRKIYGSPWQPCMHGTTARPRSS